MSGIDLINHALDMVRPEKTKKMKITNKMNLPEALVKLVTIEKHNKENHLSATTLLNGVKQIILTERYWEQLEDDVSDRIWAIWGTAIHSLLEHEGEKEFTEETLKYEIDGITITGKIDNYNMEHGILTDYKTCSIWKIKFNNFDDWKMQGSVYSWLLHKNGFKINKCRFIALIKDHSKKDAKREFPYPESPVYIYEFNVTEKLLEETEIFIKEKIYSFIECIELEDDDIPPCTPEERWDKPTKYAVMKEGRKTAIRVFESFEEAEALLKVLDMKHFIETRKGESVRCQDYCLCNQYCDYYKEISKREEL